MILLERRSGLFGLPWSEKLGIEPSLLGLILHRRSQTNRSDNLSWRLSYAHLLAIIAEAQLAHQILGCGRGQARENGEQRPHIGVCSVEGSDVRCDLVRRVKSDAKVQSMQIMRINQKRVVFTDEATLALGEISGRKVDYCNSKTPRFRTSEFQLNQNNEKKWTRPRNSTWRCPDTA